MDPKPVHKPYILTKTPKQTLLPRDYKNFDEKIEKYIRFVQTANSFVSIGLIYETIKTLYYHFAFLAECQDYAYMLIAVMVLNVIWIIVSIIGIKAINSKASISIKRYFLGMIMIFMSRIGVYLALYFTMQELVLDKFYCNAVYKGGWYIILAGAEGIYFIIMLLMIRAIIKYVQVWENNKVNYENSSNYRGPL